MGHKKKSRKEIIDFQFNEIKKQHIKICEILKIVFRGIFIALNFYSKKEKALKSAI